MNFFETKTTRISKNRLYSLLLFNAILTLFTLFQLTYLFVSSTNSLTWVITPYLTSNEAADIYKWLSFVILLVTVAFQCYGFWWIIKKLKFKTFLSNMKLFYSIIIIFILLYILCPNIISLNIILPLFVILLAALIPIFN